MVWFCDNKRMHAIIIASQAVKISIKNIKTYNKGLPKTALNPNKVVNMHTHTISEKKKNFLRSDTQEKALKKTIEVVKNQKRVDWNISTLVTFKEKNITI